MSNPVKEEWESLLKKVAREEYERGVRDGAKVVEAAIESYGGCNRMSCRCSDARRELGRTSNRILALLTDETPIGVDAPGEGETK